MRLQTLFRIVSLIVLGNYSFVYTQAFETFEETRSSEAEDTVQLTVDSTTVEEYSSDELKNKVKLYTKLQGAGIGICLAGAGSAIYGFSSATREAEEEKMISGSSLFFICEGFVAFFGGIAMTAIMNKKFNEYKTRLGKVSLYIDQRNQLTGLKMSCNF